MDSLQQEQQLRQRRQPDNSNDDTSKENNSTNGSGGNVVVSGSRRDVISRKNKRQLQLLQHKRKRRYYNVIHDFIQWLSQEGPYHPKHYYDYYESATFVMEHERTSKLSRKKRSHSPIHAICVCMTHYIIVLCVTVQSHDFLYNILTSATNNDAKNNVLSINNNSMNQCNNNYGDVNDERLDGSLHQLNNDQRQLEYKNRMKLYIIVVFVMLYAMGMLFWRLFGMRRRSDNKNKVASLTSAILYEYCWLCNVTFYASAIGIVSNRPYILWTYCVTVGIDQLLWWVDVIVGALSFGTIFPIGVAKYLIWDDATWSSRITCTHHLWTIPLLLYAVSIMSSLQTSYNNNNNCTIQRDDDGNNVTLISAIAKTNEVILIPSLSFIVMTTNIVLSRWMVPSHVYVPPDNYNDCRSHGSNHILCLKNDHFTNDEIDDEKDADIEDEDDLVVIGNDDIDHHCTTTIESTTNKSKSVSTATDECTSPVMSTSKSSSSLSSFESIGSNDTNASNNMNNAAAVDDTTTMQKSSLDQEIEVIVPSNVSTDNNVIISSNNDTSSSCSIKNIDKPIIIITDPPTNQTKQMQATKGSKKKNKNVMITGNNNNMKYLNVNLSYELWKDIQFNFLQINYDNPKFGLYLFRLVLRWQLFNMIVFVVLRYIYYKIY